MPGRIVLALLLLLTEAARAEVTMTPMAQDGGLVRMPSPLDSPEERARALESMLGAYCFAHQTLERRSTGLVCVEKSPLKTPAK